MKTDTPEKIWNEERDDFRILRYEPLPVGFVSMPCAKCGATKLSGAIIGLPDGKPVIPSADTADPNIVCLKCGYWHD